MSQRELDEAIKAIRDEAVDDTVIHGAARRVFAKVFDSTIGPEHRPELVDRIRGCADFRMLMTPYLKQALTPSRVLLLEDHTRQCVACRRALQELRAGGPAATGFDAERPASRRRSPAFVWALAASLAVGMVVGVVGGRRGLLPGQHAVRATVASVDGSLYRITQFGARLVAVGEMIGNSDELRTAKGSRAMLRLVNGTRLELGERADVSISGGWTSNTVNLEQGQMIVDAQATAERTYVSSGGLVIPVKEAILSVDSGIKGSRVAVARGLVEVQQGGTATSVSAGQQFASDYRIGVVPVAAQFAWSQNAGSYTALVNELSSLQKQLETIPSAGLRHSSNLTKYVPANTAIYAAVPNLGGTVTEVKRMFDERLANSEVLREWWSKQPGARGAELDRTLLQVASVSQYLGDELVVAVPQTAAHQNGSAVFLAQISQPGLADYLRQQLPTASGVQIVTGSSTVAAPGNAQLFIDTDNNILVASSSLAQLQAVEAGIQTSSAGAFLQTPFYSRIAKSYSEGVGYLLATDMEQMGMGSVSKPVGSLSGFANAKYLVLERRDAGGGTETRASLSLGGSRQGVASWLGNPGPIGSIDFVSPDASFAVGLVMKNPRDIATELIGLLSADNPQFMTQLQSLEAGMGVSLVDDIATPLGGDAMFALDGPLLPIPTWKFGVEVNDPTLLQKTLETLVNRYNQAPSAQAGKIQMTVNAVGGRTFYSLQSVNLPAVAAYYTFVDGYLLASTSEAVLTQAIQNRTAGYTLRTSPAFRSQLPADNSTNFSAILYNNLGPALGPLANQLKGSSVMSPAQQQAMTSMVSSSTPVLICLYGEPDGIVAATRSSFLGFNLGSLAAIQQGTPIVPLIANQAFVTRPKAGSVPRPSRN